MFKAAVIVACVLVGLTGCKTAPRTPAKTVKPAPPDWDGVATNKPATDRELTNTPPVLTIPTPPPTNPPPAVKPPTNAPKVNLPLATGWVSLDRWAANHGFEKVRRTTTGPVETFALVTPAGVFQFGLGNVAATWDGVGIHLGFAPQLADGKVFLHALDVQKNLEPLLQSRAPLKTTAKVLVLDPGHGGANTGTRSVADPRSEKFFTLDWALRTAALLATNGWQVILTRTNDVEVSLADRVALAEEHHADLFISLHFNSSGGGREQSGLETFCLTPQGMTSTLTRNYDDDPMELSPNNAFDEQNFLLALRLHRAVLQATGDIDRGVRRARFLTVLRGQNRPAALIEGGFLSNPAEARRVADPAFRQKLAEAVARALE